MKNLILIIALVATGALAMNFYVTNDKNSKFPPSLHEAYVELFAKDHIKTIVHGPLKTKLEKDFKLLFDEVSSVDAQYSEENGYYYIVFGQKDGVDKIDLLKVHKSDIENKTYTYLNLENVEVTSAVFYCRSGNGHPNPPPGICTGPCAPNLNRCLGLICGIYNGFGCDIF